MPRRATRVPLDDLDRPIEDLFPEPQNTNPVADDVLRLIGRSILDALPLHAEPIRANRVSRVRRVRRGEEQLDWRTLPDEPIRITADEAEVRREANEDLRENAEVDKVKLPRKLLGNMVICTRAMAGWCPVIIKRSEATEVEDLHEWCIHMVPHVHRDQGCDQPWDRKTTLPRSQTNRQTCRLSRCEPMVVQPHHLRGSKKPKVGKLPNHKRTLIID